MYYVQREREGGGRAVEVVVEGGISSRVTLEQGMNMGVDGSV